MSTGALSKWAHVPAVGFELIRRILLPAVLPDYVLALRAGLGSWLDVCGRSRVHGRIEGLGLSARRRTATRKPDQIMAAILIFAVVGKASDTLLILMTAPFLRWQDSHGQGPPPCLKSTISQRSTPMAPHALDKFSLNIVAGEITAIIGGSGCGKSTLFAFLSGLEQPSRGENPSERSRIARARPTTDHGVSGAAAVAWLNVEDNIGFGLRHLPAAEKRERLEDVLEAIGLAGYGRRWVKELSGGQAQRVALAVGWSPAPTCCCWMSRSPPWTP